MKRVRINFVSNFCFCGFVREGDDDEDDTDSLSLSLSVFLQDKIWFLELNESFWFKASRFVVEFF